MQKDEVDKIKFFVTLYEAMSFTSVIAFVFMSILIVSVGADPEVSVYPILNVVTYSYPVGLIMLFVFIRYMSVRLPEWEYRWLLYFGIFIPIINVVMSIVGWCGFIITSSKPLYNNTIRIFDNIARNND